MASEGTTGGKDRLSALPGEALERIFELAYEGEHTTTGAICRALLPYHRDEHCKRVEVRSAHQLQLLARRLDSGLVRMKAVRRLNFALNGWDIREPAVVDLCRRLPRLGHLSFSRHCPLVDLILSPSMTARPPLLHLTHLELAHPYDLKGEEDFEQLCDPARLLPLNSFPSLTSLTLSPFLFDEGGVDSSVIQQWQVTSLPHIRTLTLVGDQMEYNSLAGLVNACTGLQELTLFGQTAERDAAYFDGVLEHISVPITSLTFRTEPPSDDSDDPPLFFFGDDLLPRLTQLKHLHFGENLRFSHALYDNLRHIPSLYSLSFAFPTILDARELRSLVSGSTRHPSLRLLTLDTVSLGRRGYRVHVDGGGVLHPKHDAADKHVAPDWIVPEYSDPDPRFSSSSVRALVRAGAQNGVTVQGTAVDALPLYREWKQEAQTCCLLHGRDRRLLAAVGAARGGGGDEIGDCPLNLL
ncbi:hypothetical protein JCM10213_001352 [Rhodosporidiobolus nylandii]